MLGPGGLIPPKTPSEGLLFNHHPGGGEKGQGLELFLIKVLWLGSRLHYVRNLYLSWAALVAGHWTDLWFYQLTRCITGVSQSG